MVAMSALGGFSTTSTSSTPFDYQKYQDDQRAIAQQRASDRLKEMQDLWKIGFDQRQQEAETNATRAAKYRQQESERDFGQRQAMSSQDFTQNRTLQGDTIASTERMQQAGFGQERDMSKQGFEQNRALQGDYLGSQERRDAAQIAARERIQQAGFGQERDMASLRSSLKQREKSEDSSRALAAFRNR